MYCRHCGKQNTDGTRFCVSCSAPTEDSNDNSESVTKSSYTPKQVNPSRNDFYTDSRYSAKPLHNRSPFRPIHLLLIFYAINVLLLFSFWGSFSGVSDEPIGTASASVGIVFTLIFGTISFSLWWLPTIIGSKRTNGWAIFWVNFLLAWTVIGWIVALVMSLSYDHGKRLEEIEGAIRRR